LIGQPEHRVTSWNITEQLIGALKIISQRVAVRGIVSGAKDWIIEELTTHKDEAPMFDVKTFSQGDWKNMPHQKIIVIDGLIAFKGSANLTVQGWRKSANGRDHVEVVTDVDEVIRLHNKLFAPVWSDFSSRGHEIIMGDELYDEVPF